MAKVERTWDSDEVAEWVMYQSLTPPKAALDYTALRAGFIAGTVTRTKARRAFVRAFPEECTEGFDGICRCKNG